MDWIREYYILMAHFAKLNSGNVVEQVIAVHNNDAPNEATGIAFLNTLFKDAIWVQTSYNGNIRKNYAGIGYIYDLGRDAFIAPQPYPSWVLNESTCLWDAPVPMPTDGLYDWDESTTSWIKQNI
jgi:murein tripeptide amidase MpaA